MVHFRHSAELRWITRAAQSQKLNQKPTRAYGRVYLFGKRRDEARKRSLAGMALGGIDPEWDDLAQAEDEISVPAGRLKLDGPQR